MIKLKPDEQNVLEKINEKEELRSFFFRKAKNLKWFDSLADKGYFKPEQNPKPAPSKEEDFIVVPFWPATNYLVSASADLLRKENETYAVKFMEILRAVTKYAIENKFSNYRTWWQFSKIIRNLPPAMVREDDISLIEYWLNDPYERDVIAKEIGEKWLFVLLDNADQHCKRLSTRLIEVLYTVQFQESKYQTIDQKKAILRIHSLYVKRITDKIASKAGKRLGVGAVHLFQKRLEIILAELNNDHWSSIWRPAIEDHPQNHQANEAGDILVQAFRESLLALVESEPKEGRLCVRSLIESPFETIKRIAIYAIDRQYQYLNAFVDDIVNSPYFSSIFRHELWTLLHNHYRNFSEHQKRRVWDIIAGLVESVENNQVSKGATAYTKAIWLAAIKDQDENIKRFYEQCVNVSGAEPDHPDFSSFMRVGWVNHKSPFSKEQLLSMEVNELIQQLDEYLTSYKLPKGFDEDEPDLQGLVKTLHQVVKADPLRFHNQLYRFLKLDLVYIYELIDAYGELWTEKAQLPWEEIWGYLLNFCQEIVNQERFWLSENSKQRSSLVANRHWIVSGIGHLIENGTRSDEHAFPEKYVGQAETILRILLNKEKGETFKPDSDAVSVAINSPRGCCLEALINLTLRSCRLSDEQYKDHTAIWAHFQPTYDAELCRAEVNEYEFSTLVAYYLPNFLYMSKDWVMQNLENIFDQKNYQKWLCAMHGYSYVNEVYKEIYSHLRQKGHFDQALDDVNLSKRIIERIIENIVVAFINNFEKLEDETGLIRRLLFRNKQTEIHYLIWFVWTLRKNNEGNIKSKVFELWFQILNTIDLSSREGKKLASRLCAWTIFVDEINSITKPLIIPIIPFASEENQSYIVLECIARISENQPLEAFEIWFYLLETYSEDFPEEAVQKALTNLVRMGLEGIRRAQDIVSKYELKGNDDPSELLKKILSTGKN